MRKSWKALYNFIRTPNNGSLRALRKPNCYLSPCNILCEVTTKRLQRARLGHTEGTLSIETIKYVLQSQKRFPHMSRSSWRYDPKRKAIKGRSTYVERNAQPQSRQIRNRRNAEKIGHISGCITWKECEPDRADKFQEETQTTRSPVVRRVAISSICRPSLAQSDRLMPLHNQQRQLCSRSRL